MTNFGNPPWRSIQESNLYYHVVGRLSRAMRYHYANAPFNFNVAGAAGFEPAQCASQSRMCYRFTIPQEKGKAYLPHMPEGSHGYVMDTAAVLPTAVRAILFMDTS